MLNTAFERGRARSRRAPFGALAAAVALAGCTSTGEAGTDGAIGFYQRFLGDQWAWHCDFQPSCSSFGRQAIAEQGALAGLVMTADRLQRDHQFDRAEYPHDEWGHPLDPPAAHALFGPRVEDEPSAQDPQLEAELAAAPPLAQDDAAQAAFADRLWDAHEWARARIEYERLLFARPTTRFATHCHQRAALCLARVRRRGDALAHVDKIADASERAATRALVEREVERPEAALRAADVAGAPLLAGFLALEAEQCAGARERFTPLPETVRSELLATVDAIEQRPRKSRLLAGSLSALLPGSGQLYIGRPGDALAAFTTNAILIGGTVVAARRDQDVAAIALGFVAFGFWNGNIYGAANGATLHDRRRRDALLDEARGRLRQSGFFGGLAPDGDGGALGIYFGF